MNGISADVTISPKNTETATHKTSGCTIGSHHQVEVFKFFLFSLEVEKDLEIGNNDHIKDLAMHWLKHHV